jgi:hypothetical protein
VSPSKRAGDTVDTHADQPAGEDRTVDPDAPSSNGSNGAHDGNGSAKVDRPAPRPASARPKRRSTTANGTAPPERGSVSQRGASSSSITRRSAMGASAAAPDVAARAPASMSPPVPLAAPAAEEATVTSEPVVETPIALPPASPTRRVEPSTRRPSEDRRPSQPAIVVPPLPVVTPASPPAQQALPVAAFPATGEAPPLDAPYVTTTMSSHQVAPVPRLVGRRPRVRKVTRVVRHVDPWSVFKVAVVFNLVLYVVLLTAGVLLWNVAYATGTIDNLERFFESFGWSEFEFDGGAIYHNAWIAGLFGVVGLTGAAVLAATLFNLITDLVGGVRMTVLEEEVVERTMSPMRRFVVRRPNTGDDPGSDLKPQATNLPARRGPVEDPFR